MNGRHTTFISTALPYINGRPHVGHILEFVQADCFARAREEVGEDVYFLSGSDENSLKNVLAAEAAGVSTSEFVERLVQQILQLADPLSLSYDRFIRTGIDADHRDGVLRLWNALEAAGSVYTKNYRGLYCVGCEQFYTEDELVDGKCPEHERPLEMIEEENYFFRLSEYAQPLRDALTSGRIRIVPESRYNEILSLIDSGLIDFSISRSAERARGWGIPVPNDPSQVIYVWVDALANYITALGYASDAPSFERYWSSATERIHVIGKGITRFHAVYWPAMLLAAGVELPTTIFVHGYLTIDGAKLSKSAYSGRDPIDMIDAYGGEAMRFYLLRMVAPTGDAEFSEARLVQTHDSDLSNTLGNLASRTIKMVELYRGGVVPALTDDSGVRLVDVADTLAARTQELLAAFDHRQALEEIWSLLRSANVYISEEQPWILGRSDAAEDQARFDHVLYECVYALVCVEYALRPLLPRTAEALRRQFPADGTASVAGLRLESGAPLFPRLALV